MSNQIYQDPVLKKYADIIQAGNKSIKAIYYGDPMRIPKSSLPAVVLAKVDTVVMNQSNVEDVHRMRIAITVVTDVRDTISEDKTMVEGTNALYNLVEGREEGTFRLKDDSILNIIRSNMELVTGILRTDLDSGSRVEYGLTIGKRGPDMWATEASIEITTHFIQVRGTILT